MCDGAWCFQQHSTLIYSGSLGNVYFLGPPYLHGFGCLSRSLQKGGPIVPGKRENRPYWLVIYDLPDMRKW